MYLIVNCPYGDNSLDYKIDFLRIFLQALAFPQHTFAKF